MGGCACGIQVVSVPLHMYVIVIFILPRYLYMALVCMDANFRLKNQLVSNYSQDPGLGIGMVYMLGRDQYEAYVLERADQNDVRNWSSFKLTLMGAEIALDQLLRWFPGARSGKQQIHEGLTIHRCRRGVLWMVGDGASMCSRKSTEGRTVRFHRFLHATNPADYCS